MRFLLDTNALSEPRKPSPDDGYMAWMGERSPEELAVSVLSMGELGIGLSRLAPGRRRTELKAWVAEGVADFADRVLPVTLVVTSEWARVNSRHREAGRQVGAIDELIAATALAHRLTVVTRNRRDFEASGCAMISPWSA